MEGWIKLHRKITENWIWNDKPFSKGQAWIDLLMRVNHKDGKALIGNKLVDVKRGQTIWSILDIADRWGWSRKKVSNFLNMLEKEGMIAQKRTSKYTLITIENYGIYQDEGTTEEQQKNITGTSKEQQKNTNKNDKNEKNDKKDILYISSREDILPSLDGNPPYQEIANLYNSIVKSLPQVKILSDKRKRTIKANWDQHKNIEFFREAFRKAEESDFLSGRNGKWTGCNFDWLVNYNNMIKVLEGTYDRASPQESLKASSTVFDYEAAKKSKYGW